MRRLYTFAAIAAMLAGIVPAGAKDLHINNTDYKVDTLVYRHQVGPGVEYAYYRLPDRPIDIHVLEADLTNPYLVFEVWNGGNKAVAGETPLHRYQAEDRPGHDMIAAHNGDFYTTANGEAGMSRMGLIGAGECIFNPTGTALFVIDGNNKPYAGPVNFSGTVTDASGNRTRLHTVNQLKLEWETSTFDNQLSLFTPAFGTNMHSSITGGKVAILRPVAGSAVFPVNTPLEFTVVSVADNPGEQAIPEDGAVLFGRGTSATYLGSLAEGSKVTLNLGASMPDYPQVTTFREAVGGSNHIILRNGEICNINNPDLHPRTFMGINKEGTKIWTVVADGRTSTSVGINLDDEGRVLAWLGAWDGLNLDGGGSSAMVVNGETKNHTSDGAMRAVGNGAILYSTAPVDDEVAQIAFEPRAYQVPVTSYFRPVVYGYNKYGLLKTKDLAGVTFTCDPAVGVINSRGEFVASGEPAHGYIYADFGNGITARQAVVIQASPIKLDYTSYVVDNRAAYPIRLSAPVGRFTYAVDPSAAQWTSADPAIATVSEGWITGIANGTTTITGTASTFNGTVTVNTEIPDGPAKSLVAPFDPDAYTLKQTGGRGIQATAENNGLTITYTGNGSARGAYIALTPNDKFTTYSLPEAIELDINPGDADVQWITTNYANAHGDHSTVYFTNNALPKNTLSTFRINLADLFDIKDNSCYPVTLSGLRLSMGASKSGQQFTISIPRLEQTYADPGAVRDLPYVPSTDVTGPVTYYNLQGIRVANPASGSLVICRQGTSSTLVRIP